MEWAYLDGKIAIQSDDGEIIFPNAKFLYTQFQHLKDELFSNKITDVIPDLVISNYALELFIELNIKTISTNIELIVNVKAKRYDLVFNFEKFNNLIPDYLIINKTWYPLYIDELNKIIKIFEEIDILDVGEINLKQYFQIKQNKSITIIDNIAEKIDATNVSKALEAGFLPKKFIGELYPFQLDGYHWLKMIVKNNFGCILGDEMGLGKTIQVIAVLAEPDNNEPSLVICPATLIANWIREINKFTQNTKVLAHWGHERTGFPSVLRGYDIVITSYETAVRDVLLFSQISWNRIVLDEAQAIKNPQSKRTKTIKKLPRNSSIAMTGTPIENSLMDSWSIADFIVPGYLGEKSAFESKFINDLESAKKLEPYLSPIMLRRRVKEVLDDLPDKIEIPQSFCLDNDEINEYEEVRSQSLNSDGNQGIFNSLVYLRMYCSHPRLLGYSKTKAIDKFSKFSRLIELVDQIITNGNKTLIFTSYTEMIDLIISDLDSKFGVFCGRIDGGVKIEDRQNIVDKFNNIDKPSIMVLNPRAGGTGLNITSATNVIHYNPEWNPAIEDQATARAYRKGQKDVVFVYKLYYENTIEQVIEDRLDFKRALFDQAITGVDGSRSDRDDIIRALNISPLRD